MKIEIGKVYLNRLGQQRLITAKHPGAIFPFMDDMKVTYREDGKYLEGDADHVEDLVIEFGTSLNLTPFEQWVRTAVVLGRDSYGPQAESRFIEHLNKVKGSSW